MAKILHSAPLDCGFSADVPFWNFLNSAGVDIRSKIVNIRFLEFAGFKIQSGPDEFYTIVFWLRSNVRSKEKCLVEIKATSN